ncbi:sensor histidine kinase [Pseudanabaena sp. ABRG5-3]|uniref:sensor histidine kinase n=1 Tax=Pseudanabaena sp. ABRG5-3 TaxID=685565 RepID=UPI000DC6F8F2|nr:sensor histidine kinase [Pseudanabaena sp. ABRG5-3]BBC25942.1 signal transduction histidine kinase [Pseudanabaena sp. ABRG5-3]
MQIRLNPRSPLLQLLLTLEWILLGLVAITQILVTTKLNIPTDIVFNEIGLLIFAVLGIAFPIAPLHKLVYIIAEFALIFLLTIKGNISLFQLLFIVLVIRNCVMLEGRSRSLVTGIALFSVLVCVSERLRSQSLLVQVDPDRTLLYWVGFIVMLGLVILFLQLLVESALAERKSREELMVANNRLREYAIQVEELATVQERNRIAREIHDSLGHSLTGFNLHLEAALQLLQSEPDEAKQLLLEAKQLGSTALNDVRVSVRALRSEPLEGRSFKSAIQSLVEEFQRSTGIAAQTDIDNLTDSDRQISPQLKIIVYRIVQESLTNISKHSEASLVNISCQVRNQDLEIVIEDNGKGFDITQNVSGFGLQGMQERVMAVSGNLEVKTSQGNGCKIIARFRNIWQF